MYMTVSKYLIANRLHHINFDYILIIHLKNSKCRMMNI